MIDLITRPGAWLLQQAATSPDTLVMKTVAAERGWFETVATIANGITSIALVVLVVAGAPMAWVFWRTVRRMQQVLDHVQAEVAPLARRAGSIADNLDYITTSIRHDVQQVNATIASANRRLQDAVDMTESRLKGFNALLQVAQEEAEQAFVSTAAAVRGVRSGVAAFGAPDDEPAERAGGGSEHDDDDATNEESNGGAGGRPAARPRLRSRGRRS